MCDWKLGAVTSLVSREEITQLQQRIEENRG